VFELAVDAVVVKEEGIGQYSVLLHDIEGGTGWELPGGPVVEAEHDLDDGNAWLRLSCFHYISEQTGIDPEAVEDNYYGMHQYQCLITSEEHKTLSVVYYCMVDEDQHDEVDKQLKNKCGNARFFPIQVSLNSDGTLQIEGLPKLKYDYHEEAVAAVMQHFTKKEN